MSNIQKRPQSGLKEFLEKDNVKSKLAAVCKGAMRPDDLVRLALVATLRNPQLLQCGQASILSALMDSAELGIRPGGMNGRGYLIPRYNRNTKSLECCFDPGYRGLIDIMMATGAVKRIEAHPIFERDTFRVVFGLKPVLEHEPYLGEDRGEIVGAYALAEFKDGLHQVEFLTKGDIAKIRATSTSKGGPWEQWDDQMARKSAIRRLFKFMPSTPETEKAERLALRTEVADLADIDFGEVDMTEELPAPKTRTQALKEHLSVVKEEPEAVEVED